MRALVDELRGTSNLRDAATVLRSSAQLTQMTHVAVILDASHPDAPTDEDGESLVEQLGWPRAFIDEWIHKGFAARSPAVVRARLEHLPFIWFAAAATEDSAQATALRGLGITTAVSVPVRLPRGRFALVTWMGPGDEAVARQLLEWAGPELLLLAHYFLELVRRRWETPTVSEDLARLTSRELQCLTEVAKGASDSEAARALGLTARTIRFHLQNAGAKLGARSRSHAVALATQLGIVGSIF